MKHSLKFASAEELRRWFEDNHTTSPGLWIRFEYAETPSSVTPEEALRAALSFGWVDDRIKRINDLSYRKKFIPRRDGSLWTDTQKALVNELTELGLMEKSGLDIAARAKLDGSWDAADASPVTDTMLETFTAALRPHGPAYTNYMRMSESAQRSYAAGYCSAKRQETRARRLLAAVEKLSADPSDKTVHRKSAKKSSLSNT